MVSGNGAHATGAVDHLGSSEARQFLSRLSEAFGVGGVLMVQKSGLGPEGADLAPNSTLRWPRCECGSPKCPDYEHPDADVMLEADLVRHGRSRRVRHRSRGGIPELPPGRGGGGQSWP
jgi:hypothetical protein